MTPDLLIADIQERLRSERARLAHIEQQLSRTCHHAGLAADAQQCLRNVADLEFALSAARAGQMRIAKAAPMRRSAGRRRGISRAL